MSKKTDMMLNALSYYGLNETIGGLVNSKVLDFVNNVTNEKHTRNIPWCAAFVGSILKENDYQHSVSLTARSYMKVGKGTRTPEIGDIVVLWRGSKEGWKGHVGFYVGETDNLIFILGGNQNNMVCIKPYPKKQLLGYRKPMKQEPMAVGLPTQ